MWSTLSLVTLLGGCGLVLGLYGRYSRSIGWHESEERQVRFVPPASVALTPAQRVTAWFFLVVKVALRTRKTAAPEHQMGTALEATLYTEIKPARATARA